MVAEGHSSRIFPYYVTGALTASSLPVIARVVLAGYLRGLPGRDVDDPPRGRAYRPRQPGGHPDAARGLHPDHRDHRTEAGRADRRDRRAGVASTIDLAGIALFTATPTGWQSC